MTLGRREKHVRPNSALLMRELLLTRIIRFPCRRIGVNTRSTLLVLIHDQMTFQRGKASNRVHTADALTLLSSHSKFLMSVTLNAYE